MTDFDNLFTKKQLYLMECQKREFNKLPKRNNSARERMLTFNNMHLTAGMTFTPTHHFPILEPYTGSVDFEVYAYSRRKGLSGENQALHFFAYDCMFDNAVWRNLESTTYNMRNFDYLFTPDYSLYVDEQLTHQNIEFTYRTRFAGAYWQQCGFNVIPPASWGNANSFSYSLEGLPTGSVLAVCGTGNKRCASSFELWKYAIRRIEAELLPIVILVYGEPVEVSGIHTPLKFIPDHISKTFRKWK